jgi:HemK-like putative methylase
VAHELPDASIVASDISTEALATARINVERHGVSDRVRLVHSDLLDGVTGQFDVIAVNPPYVRELDRPGLQPEVGGFEPHVALFGGASGLDMIARLVREAPPHLRPGGSLLFEFGYGQEEDVEQLIAAEGRLKMVGVSSDIQGIPRVAIARLN